MIRPGKGSTLFQCTVCGCWDVSSWTDFYTRQELEKVQTCSGCTVHCRWHGKWPQEATKGMLLDPRGFLYRPESLDMPQ